MADILDPYWMVHSTMSNLCQYLLGLSAPVLRIISYCFFFQASQVFKDIQAIVNLASDWLNISTDLTDVLNNGRVANFVRVSIQIG